MSTLPPPPFQQAIKALRDQGVIPEATAAAFLPAPRRKAALCRNHRGSVHSMGSPCGAPAYRVYENQAWDQSEPKWQLRHNLCERCLGEEAPYMDDPDAYRVVPI